MHHLHRPHLSFVALEGLKRFFAVQHTELDLVIFTFPVLQQIQAYFGWNSIVIDAIRHALSS